MLPWPFGLPTQSEDFLKAKHRCEHDGEEKSKLVRSELTYVKALRENLERDRNSLLKTMSSTVKPMEDISWTKLQDHLRVDQLLREHQNHLETEVKTIEFESATEENRKRSGSPGLASWAEGMLIRYGKSFESFMSIAGIGAGLTYATIFTTIRGDVGLITWAFALFVNCFFISASILCHLTWFKGLKPVIPFLGTRQTSRFIGVAQLVSTSCLMVAVGLLLATVVKLRYGHDSDGHRIDVPLILDFNPDIAGWVCLGLLCLGFLVMALVWSECVITGMSISWQLRERDELEVAKDERAADEEAPKHATLKCIKGCFDLMCLGDV